MVQRIYPQTPLLAAATAIWRGEKILLAKRSLTPNEGSWAMPGGMVEVGEKLEQAAVREVREETALSIQDPMFLRFHEIIIKDNDQKIQRHYVLAIFAAVSASGIAVAGDDAAAIGWFRLDELSTISLTENSEVFIRESHKILQECGKLSP